jgi:hypothetical protein
MVEAHLLVSRPTGGVLKHFFQELHQMLRSNLLAGLPSGVFDSVVKPARVNLFLQRDDSTGQPVGRHVDSSKATLFQEVDLFGQGCDMRELKGGMFFTPRPLKFRESTYKRREVGFMILVVEPRPVPSPKGSLHWEVKEAGVRAGLETHTTNNLAVSGARLILQEKVTFEQMEIGRNAS